MNKKIKQFLILTLVLISLFSFVGCDTSDIENITDPINPPSSSYQESNSESKNESFTDSTETPNNNSFFKLSDIPDFSESPYYTINNNNPFFTDNEKTNTSAFEEYLPLDNLGRCQVTYANVCKELMPTEDRGNISSVYPSGWKFNGKSNNNEYDTELVDGGRIYNRCHLIGFQLAGENANEKNLITGTRYLNVTGMLPFENMVADYIKETDNHVLYRVTPVYKDNELVARGVLMEAWSIEDNGDGICFNVYCYNVQPGIEIDYATGKNHLSNNTSYIPEGTKPLEEYKIYILNTNSKKFHLTTCSSAAQIANKNKREFNGLRNDLIEQNYKPCNICNP